MHIDDLLEQIGDSDIRFPAINVTSRTEAPANVDALFHLPLLAVTIMTAARHEPFQVVSLGRTVAGTLVERFAALRDAPNTLLNSITMRRRSVEALVFLEATGLVVVSHDDRREISLSQEGKTRFDRAKRMEGDLGLLIRQLVTAQDRAVARRGQL